MITQEKFNQYFWYLFGVIAVVFFWAGIWDGLGNISYLQNPLISLFAGLFLLGLSRIIFRDANPFGSEGDHPAHPIIRKIKKSDEKHHYDIQYKDQSKSRDLSINAKNLHKIEKNFMIFHEGEREIFIPLKKVTQVLYKGKKHWQP